MFNILSRLSLISKIIIAIFLGVGVALLFPNFTPYLSLLGELFIKALKSVAPILVFVLVLASIANFKWAFIGSLSLSRCLHKWESSPISHKQARIGDSSTNVITPFMFYMPLVLTYMRQYDKQVTYGTLLKYTWRYSVGILADDAILLLYLLRIPMGL